MSKRFLKVIWFIGCGDVQCLLRIGTEGMLVCFYNLFRMVLLESLKKMNLVRISLEGLFLF